MSDVRQKHSMNTNSPTLPPVTPLSSYAEITRLAELIEQSPEFAAVRSVSEDVDTLAGECIT